MTNQDAFYSLWNSMPSMTLLADFPFHQLDEEDFVLAEAMVGKGINRLMEFKTQLLNAKYKLQSSNMQRGILPQTEKGKEGVHAKTDTDKAETLQIKADCRQTKVTVG